MEQINEMTGKIIYNTHFFKKIKDITANIIAIIVGAFICRWRLVIHGGIDGFSRRIVFLKCSDNNRAETVFHSFERAVLLYGLPLRVRSDKGRENCDVAWYMLNHPQRGPEMASYITGRSVHNQRIERLWRDVYTVCTYIYHQLFNKMEDQGLLDADDELKLFCLHYVFIPRINRDLLEFSEAFNNTPMRTERNKTPVQLWNMGMLEGRGPPTQEEIEVLILVFQEIQFLILTTRDFISIRFNNCPVDRSPRK